jgi:hypothetical protein
MPEDTGGKDAGQAGDPAAATQPPPRAASRASDANRAEQEVWAIPGVSQLRTVADQIIVNIGVLGDIHGGTVKAAGQASPSGLGEAISQAGATLWQVQQTELERLDQVFVPVDSVVDTANKILESRHVLVLQGRAHWGKAATSQWLLNQRHKGQVFVVEPRTGSHLRDLAATLESDGYVIDTLSAEHIKQLRTSTLLKLTARLQATEPRGHLVITVDALTPLPVELADYLVICPDPPPALDVLWRHLERELGQDTDEAFDKARDWISERLQHGLPPGRVRDLAAALATMVRDGGGLEQAKQDYQRCLLRYLAEWFRQHPGPRERCFMTAAAVLNGAAYQDIATASDKLERLVFGEITGTGPIPRRWSRPFSPRKQRAEDIGATLLRSPDGSTDGPLSPVQLEELLMQAMVLAHLWYQHDEIFGHLFEWLDELGRDPDFEVSGRVAAAAGTLCALDFSYLRRRLLERWAGDPSEDRAARVSAAVALATAAQEPKLATEALTLLDQWSVCGIRTGLPWTAATAYGLLNREEFLPDALEGLRTITERHGWPLAWVVARSLVNLCEARHAAKTLDQLRIWINAPPSSTLASNARIIFEGLTRVRADRPDSYYGIPVLLDLATRDDSAAEAVRQLWNALAGSPRPKVKSAARSALYDWFTLADTNGQCRQAIDVVLRPLLFQHTTRQRTRRALRHCAFERKPGSASARDLLRVTGTPLDNALDWIYAAWRAVDDRPTER